MIAAVGNEILLGFFMEFANKHDKTLFAKPSRYLKENFSFNYSAKYLVDFA
jgi:hypothetical protein